MDLRLATLHAQFAARERSPVELTEELLAAAPATTGFAQLDPEGALQAARAAEEAYRDGTAGPLTGIPAAVKDLIDTAGIRTSYGSPRFREHVPERDARVVTTLRETGAVVLGKTRTHEFAWGITSEPTGEGPCRNPWGRDRIAGGSSGGSAVAVAAGVVSLALGTDTAGSVRIPAAFCGVVGFKPTYGTFPVDGVFPLAPSFDHVGLLARDVADLLPLTGPAAVEPPARVGRLRHPFEPALDPAVQALFDAALPGDVIDLPLAIEEDFAQAFAIVQADEALQVHRSRGLHPEGKGDYDPRNEERLDAAATRSPEEVRDARVALARLRDAMDAALATVDVAISPVHATIAPPIGEAGALRDLVLPFTTPQSVAGVPACAVPIGLDQGMPVGLQVCAARGADALVLATAATFPVPFGAWPT